MLDSLLSLDRELLIYLNSLGSQTYDSFWIFITQQRNWTPFFLLIFAALFFKLDRKVFVKLMLTVVIVLLLVLAITESTKELVQRLRPSQEPSLQNVLRILSRPTNYSFFSGHASTSFSIAVLLWLSLRRKLKWIGIFFIWPVLFTASRIYLGVHYPTDILVGIFVGGLTGYLTHRFIKDRLEFANN
ncbi:phosphatase PAP2 family protein [Spongiivirga citrea]|uniref:Phosphatase PAP2 family protein n=1 Tax=Spongiivirga citrea TaxID=1481457 RepID=A0A6M0CNS8_9FLAO|nr:phosphatase PAP2 family protein [Spongiivirga citrea]NER18603.1 phosphatase PAP2 family protein [Spongiivirga citrea]